MKEVVLMPRSLRDAFDILFLAILLATFFVTALPQVSRADDSFEEMAEAIIKEDL